MSQYFTPAIPPSAGNWSFNIEEYNGYMYIPLVASGYNQIKVVNIANPFAISYINLPHVISALSINAFSHTLYYLGGPLHIYKIDLNDPTYTSVPLINAPALNLPTADYVDDATQMIYVANSGSNQVLVVQESDGTGLVAPALTTIGRVNSFTPYNEYIYMLGFGSGLVRVTPNADPNLIASVVTAYQGDLFDPAKGGLVFAQTWALFREEYSPGLFYMSFT